MVLIISDKDDLSTHEVIDWLRYYKIPFLRISKEDNIIFNKIFLGNNETDIDFYINQNLYKLTDFKAFWYRRGHYNFFLKELEGNTSIIKQANAHLRTELKELADYFRSYVAERSINKYDDIYFNKLKTLKIAANLGIRIPESIITNEKKELLNFLKRKKNIITKNYSQGVFIFGKNTTLSTPTREITNNIVESLPDTFGYSLFKEQIEKVFELRIFYLFGKFYASAIFSQNDPKTRVDFRNYNIENPNRTPPFKLPKEIERKLERLMKEVYLNIGSIDMLVSKTNEYVFLEINPIGQFAQVSKPCNYYLEELFAKEIKKIIKNGIK
ncbi:grasp-with-spasm system ATP-grasp peptide maturase [Flavobacterium sp.]|uniref:grasp-with-spasm system ATP-grasp peptide maturase n=1 Tax=Flavobacterium sp. TaxID=239 RepID=UPI00374CF9D6